MHEIVRSPRIDASRNRVKVIAAAAQVLASDGTGASMREIARQAGVGLATIYRQFPNKEALILAIIAARLETLLEEAKSLALAEDAGDVFFDFFSRAVTESRGERLLVDALQASGINHKDSLNPIYQELGVATQVLLEKAQKIGAVSRDVDNPTVLALIVAMCAAARAQQWDDEAQYRALEVVYRGLRRK